jgi:hypothetical protein
MLLVRIAVAIPRSRRRRTQSTTIVRSTSSSTIARNISRASKVSPAASAAPPISTSASGKDSSPRSSRCHGWSESVAYDPKTMPISVSGSAPCAVA